MVVGRLLQLHLQRIGVCAPQHEAGRRRAVVAQFGRRRQRRVGHLLNVGVGGRGLGGFLLAEGLFEGASQLNGEEKETHRDKVVDEEEMKTV